MAWTRLELRDRTAPPQAASTTPVGLWTMLALTVAVVAFSLAVGAESESPKAPDATFRAEEHLLSAVVGIRRSGSAEQPCTWHAEDGRWHCGGQDFAFVGPYAGVAAGRPLRCMWLHPHAAGATTVVRWPELNLGDHLEAHFRLLDDVGPGQPTRLQIFASGQSIGTLVATDGRDHPDLDVDLPIGRNKGELRLEISVADNDWRLACAEVLMTGKRRGIGDAPIAVDKKLKYAPPSNHDQPSEHKP